MKQTRTAVAIAALALLAGWEPISGQSRKDDKADVEFQAAIHSEMVEGDLAGAIRQYKKVAQSGNRVVAAQALIRMAECYQKLGDAESKKIYERVLRDYADQKDAAAIARSRLGGSLASNSSGVLVRQIWTGDDVNLSGQPSPDGRYFVYSDWSSGNLNLRDLKSGQSRFLTKDGGTGSRTSGALYPVFSPDGKQVAYQWYGDVDSIRVVNVDGSGMRIVTKTAQAIPIEWSPDAKQIVAVISSPTHQIALISAADGSVTQLKSTGRRYPSIGGFSQDGQWLVYSVDGGIFAIARDGSRETLLDGSGSDGSPFWTPDGQGVFFTSHRSGSKALWSLRVAAGRAMGAPELVRPNMGEDANLMGFDRNGSFYYGTYNRQVDVYTADIDPQTLKPVGQSKRLSQKFVGSNWGPAWSPDGKSIAFFRADSSGPRAIIIRSVSSGEERTLPVRIRQNYVPGYWSPFWLPDGRSLFVQDAAGNGWGFKQIDVDTGSAKVVLEGLRTGANWALSPDGKTVYYSSREGPLQSNLNLIRLMKRNLEAGDEVELYRAESPGVGFFGLAVSPDGAYLAFSRNLAAGQKRTLMTVSTAGGPARAIYEGTYTKPTPFLGAWSADGRQILFAGHTAQRRELWAIPAEGGEPRNLMNMEQISFAQLSPDGRSIAFTGTKSKGELWVIDNLLSDLRTSR